MTQTQPTPDNTSAVIAAIAAISTFLTMAASQLFSYLRRRDDIRERLEMRKMSADLHEELKANTAISKQAFTEANNVNLKMAALAGDRAAIEELSRRALKIPAGGNDQ